MTTPRAESPAQTLAEQVGQVLAGARGTRSRYEVSRGMGWSGAIQVVKLEKGEANATLGRLERVARSLGGHLEVTFVPDVPVPD